jgi:hypothetical protein
VGDPAKRREIRIKSSTGTFPRFFIDILRRLCALNFAVVGLCPSIPQRHKRGTRAKIKPLTTAPGTNSTTGRADRIAAAPIRRQHRPPRPREPVGVGKVAKVAQKSKVAKVGKVAKVAKVEKLPESRESRKSGNFSFL